MRTLFWAVDCQNDFIHPDGKLYVPKAEEIIPKLEELSYFASENKITVVNTMDKHTKDTLEISATPDFIRSFPEHCMEDTDGQELIDEMYVTDLPYKMAHLPRKSFTVQHDRPLEKEFIFRVNHIIIEKDVFNVFEGNSHAKDIVKWLGPDLIVVYGVASDYCVNHAVLGLAELCDNVVVAIDAIKAIDNTPLRIFNLYQDWLHDGAWLASTDHIKRLILNDRRCYV
jgi:nicotinamidase/pyrazinamidase